MLISHFHLINIISQISNQYALLIILIGQVPTVTAGMSLCQQFLEILIIRVFLLNNATQPHQLLINQKQALFINANFDIPLLFIASFYLFFFACYFLLHIYYNLV
jgi:hypothetical protein